MNHEIAQKPTIEAAIDAARAMKHSHDHIRYLNYTFLEWKADQLKVLMTLEKLKK